MLGIIILLFAQITQALELGCFISFYSILAFVVFKMKFLAILA